MLAIPWAVVSHLGYIPHGWWIPWVLAAVGMVQSLTHRPSTVDLVLDGEATEALRRRASPASSSTQPLAVAHITDTHLGPFVSEDRLRVALERVVAAEPDLVLLTGDFMTMESHDQALLERAFAPLAAMQGQVFASRGNHDLEAPEVLSRAFDTLGITLLIDDEACVDTAAGAVQLVGIDFKFRGVRDHITTVSERFPRREDHLRIVLSHHPGHFTHIPEGLGDLVLAGHTHGGQLGLLSFGINATFMRLAMASPDHGFWAKGTNRLYVNRGFGHYGFPLRIGVSAEESILRVFRRD